jgi:hypothetical protein
MRRGPVHIAAIAVLGLILALALGAFAHAIARDTVALPATTLSGADEPLAPAQARRTQPTSTAQRKKPEAAPKRARGRTATTETTETTETTPRTSTTSPGTTTEADSSGRGRGRGRGRGSGSDSSGSGSGSGSNSGSGSDSSGSGSGGGDD